MTESRRRAKIYLQKEKKKSVVLETKYSDVITDVNLIKRRAKIIQTRAGVKWRDAGAGPTSFELSLIEVEAGRVAVAGRNSSNRFTD